MSLDVIELMSESDRQAYADYLANELAKCSCTNPQNLTQYVSTVHVTGKRWARVHER